MKIIRSKPSEWQTEPDNIETDKVQLWHNGIMLTANITKQEARQMVIDGTAFIITGQAIGSIDNNGNRNS